MRNSEALRKFYDEITPPPLGSKDSGTDMSADALAESMLLPGELFLNGEQVRSPAEVEPDIHFGAPAHAENVSEKEHSTDNQETRSAKEASETKADSTSQDVPEGEADRLAESAGTSDDDEDAAEDRTGVKSPLPSQDEQQERMAEVRAEMDLSSVLQA